MSSSVDTLSLVAGTCAIQAGYAGQYEPDEIIHPPYTRGDVGCMYYIKDSLAWLISEIKSGKPLTLEKHDLTIRTVLGFDRALREKERAYRAKSNPYHKPARSPNGTGGQFDFAPGGARAASQGRRSPLYREAMTNKLPGGRPDDELEQMLEGGGGRGGAVYSGRMTSPTPKSPVANSAVGKIQKLDRSGADDLQEVLTMRASGKVSPKETAPHIRDAADHVEAFLGGKVSRQDIKSSRSNDLVIQKGDKKFRMEVKRPGFLKDRKTPDEPHFHFQQMDENGKWQDASDLHKNYFRKD